MDRVIGESRRCAVSASLFPPRTAVASSSSRPGRGSAGKKQPSEAMRVDFGPSRPMGRRMASRHYRNLESGSDQESEAESIILPCRRSGPLPSIRTRTIVPRSCSAFARLGTSSTVIRSPEVLPETCTASSGSRTDAADLEVMPAPSEIRGSTADAVALFNGA